MTALGAGLVAVVAWAEAVQAADCPRKDDRLKIARKGIILLHEPKARTAAMLPAFLRFLRDNDYHVVHVVPTGPDADFEGVP